MSKISSVIQAFITFVIAGVILNVTQLVVSIVYQNILVVRYTGQGIEDEAVILEMLTTELSSTNYFTMLSMVSISVIAIIYGIHYWIHYYEKGDQKLVKYFNVNHVAVTAIFIIGIILATCCYCLLVSSDTMSFRKEFLSVQSLSFSFGMSAVLAELILLPIAEETLFRGVIFKRLKRSCSIYSAIVIQALFCGIFQLNVKKGIYFFLLSMLLGYMMVEKNSVLYCIRIRIYLTVISFVVWKWLYQMLPMNLAFHIVLAMMAILLLGTGFYLMMKDKTQKKNELDEG